MPAVLTEQLLSEISLRPCSNTTTTTQAPQDQRMQIIADLYVSKLSSAYRSRDWDSLYSFVAFLASAWMRDLYATGNSQAASNAATSLLEEIGFAVGNHDVFEQKLARAIESSDLQGAVTLMQHSLNPPVNTPAESWTEERNVRRRELIDRKIQQTITAEELEELDRLQQQAAAYLDQQAPLPIDAARRMHKDLLEKKRQHEQQGNE